MRCLWFFYFIYRRGDPASFTLIQLKMRGDPSRPSRYLLSLGGSPLLRKVSQLFSRKHNDRTAVSGCNRQCAAIHYKRRGLGEHIERRRFLIASGAIAKHQG